MQASDVINVVRLMAATPAQSGGRWSDANLASIISMGQQDLMQKTLFPESRLTQTASGTQQLFSLPETYALYRVYVNGQIAVPISGNIDTLEGDQLGFFDQMGQGVQVTGSDGPVGNTGTASPTWTIQTPQSYPFISDWGSPAPQTGPSVIGQRPRYYRRGGAVGFVPQIANTATIDIDAVLVPAIFSSPTTALLVPTNYMSCLAWYTVMIARQADDTQSSPAQVQFAMGMFDSTLKELRTWVRKYSLEQSQILVRNDRPAYTFGRNVNGSWGGN